MRKNIMKKILYVLILIPLILTGCEEGKKEMAKEIKIGQHPYYFEKTIEKKVG